MSHSSAALSLAKALLSGGSRYRREANVAFDAAQLLGNLTGVDSADIEREHPSGSGRIDIFLPRFRTVIEVKKHRHARAAHLHDLPPELAEAQNQMEGYLATEIEGERARLNRSGQPVTDKRWTGIVCDGLHWNCWTYSGGDRNISDSRQPSFRILPGAQPEELLDALSNALNPDADLKTWIPADPSEIFRNRHEALDNLYRSMPARLRPGTRTKLALWRDMLRASGLSPQGRAGDRSQFVLHSFLIAVARMVTHLLSHGSDDWRVCLRDGFASWVLDWPGAEDWAAALWETVRRYDWRRRRGDVLRSLYESFVHQDDRHIFGEYYTPDWLAGMMIEQALDEDWLKRSISEAEFALETGNPLEGIGVLDPACGSGTFLYHAALRILNAEAIHDLLPQRQADVAAMLVHGIDVHPVAVEVARATVLRALPVEPGMGAAAIRVFLGDSLLTHEDHSSLFGHREGAMRLETPRGSEIYIPLEFVRRDSFPSDMRRLVLAASERKALPPYLLERVGESARRDLQECRDVLEDTVEDEGNSVWTWYAVNRASPHLLAERKVDRVVANPPWVRLSTIQEQERKRAMEHMGAMLSLQSGGRLAPHLDIAAFFVLRVRDLYLQCPESDRGIWLVKRSALQSGHWARFRRLHQAHLTQTVDLINLQPFGGGDARRCCLLAEHTAFRTSGSGDTHPRLKAAVRESNGNRPKPSEEWSGVRHRLRLAPAHRPPPQGPSGYLPSEFRQGATIVPHVLLLASVVHPQGRRRVSVETVRSKHQPWAAVRPQEIEVPRTWISRLYRSQDLFPFAVSDSPAQAVIPANEAGELALESATSEPGWRRLSQLYEIYRGKGRNTPRTLLGRIDYGGGLSTQPRDGAPEMQMVLYPTSGDRMRAARVAPGSVVVDSSVYWHTATCDSEAGYLIALLNAPSLRRAYKHARTSGRHFHQHPWRRVPIPRFDPEDSRHSRLAELCGEAEAGALQVRLQFPDAGQVKVSTEVRARLVKDGILERIDALVASLLPKQAGA